MDDAAIASFKEKLENLYTYPASYTFKFIVPMDKKMEVKSIFKSKGVITEKESRNGKFVSVSVKMMAGSSEEIINYYLKAHTIEGIIAL